MISWKTHLLRNGERNPWALESGCGRYIIGKAIVRGEAIYSLWDGLTLVGRYPSASEAQQAATGEKIPERLDPVPV